MTEEAWRGVDDYLVSSTLVHDEGLTAALAAASAAGLPAINVAPNQGKLLHILSRSIRAERILEIGTLGGYSTIWLARALPPQGRLVSLEYSDKHANVARASIAKAGLAEQVEVRVGAALDSLAALDREGTDRFDFVFIDADKRNNWPYFDWAVAHARPGALVVVDNVVRSGAVLEEGSDNPDIRGIRSFFERLGADGRVSATAIQTVGSKGWDGIAVALVL